MGLVEAGTGEWPGLGAPDGGFARDFVRVAVEALKVKGEEW